MLLVSACLLGCPCRYDGKHNHISELCRWLETKKYIAVCPEVEGGLPTPRQPAERREERVVCKDGTDCTEAFFRGAEKCWKRVAGQVEYAILKAKSPSCGKCRIYDGTFTRTLTRGNGVFAELLQQKGIPVYDETDWEELREKLDCEIL